MTFQNLFQKPHLVAMAMALDCYDIVSLNSVEVLSTVPDTNVTPSPSHALSPFTPSSPSPGRRLRRGREEKNGRYGQRMHSDPLSSHSPASTSLLSVPMWQCELEDTDASDSGEQMGRALVEERGGDKGVGDGGGESVRRATSVLSFLRRPISVLTQVTTRGKSSLSSASSAVASIPPGVHSALKRLSKRLRRRRRRDHRHGDLDASLKSSSTLSDPEARAVCPSSLKRRLESSRADRESRRRFWRSGWWAGLWRRGQWRGKHDGCSGFSCHYYVDPHGKWAVHAFHFSSSPLSAFSPPLSPLSLPLSPTLSPPYLPPFPPPSFTHRQFLPLLELSGAHCFYVQFGGRSLACNL